MLKRIKPTILGIGITLLFTLLALPLGPAQPLVAHAQSGDGLVGYWPFDEGSGGFSADLSGNGNRATLHSAAGFTPNTAPISVPNPSALVSVSDPNSYATAPGTTIDGLQQFTISFWVRFNAKPPGGARIPLVTLGDKADITAYITAGNPAYADELLFNVSVSGIKYTMIYQQGIQDIHFTDGAYHHIVGSFDGSNIRLAFDDRYYGQPFTTYGGTSAQGTGVQFGSTGAPLNGALDDVRIYNRAIGWGEVFEVFGGCARAQGIPVAECQALLDLYNSTGGDGWTNRAGWVQNTQPCSWYGVLCNNGHVFVLHLPSNGLRGTISPLLGSLSSLIVLDLSGNQLTGQIPYELGGLSALQTLDLYNNQLNQTIPFTLGGLPHLGTLRLYNNQLRGEIPPQLAGLTPTLTTLDIGYNMLSATDPALLSMLNAQQPGWAATQTVAPTNLQATVTSSSSVALSWEPIAYSGDGGYYDVLAMPQSGSTFSSIGHTANKSASGFTVTGLTPGTSYSFLVRTFTPKHDLQQNDLLSDASDIVSATPHDVAQAPATITIVLDTQPDSRTNFSFTGGLGAFALDDISPQDGDAYASSKSFTVPTGTYTVTEALPASWYNANIFCSPTTGSIADLSTNQIIINAAAGANITCTFVTQRAGQIVAGAYNDHNHNHVRNGNDEWLSGWQMQIRSLHTQQILTQATNQDGRAIFNNLPPGLYMVCETLKAGWNNITPSVVDTISGQPCYTVTVEPGQAVWARFGNSRTALAGAALAEADTASIDDIIVCELPATDDAGNLLAAARDPWEEREATAAGFTVFLPLVVR